MKIAYVIEAVAGIGIICLVVYMLWQMGQSDPEAYRPQNCP
jgi:hypothetical protein